MVNNLPRNLSTVSGGCSRCSMLARRAKRAISSIFYGTWAACPCAQPFNHQAPSIRSSEAFSLACTRRRTCADDAALGSLQKLWPRLVGEEKAKGKSKKAKVRLKPLLRFREKE